MTVFNGTPNQNNTFNGADTVADRFNFATADLNNLDTVKGGGGDVVDILAFTTAGTVTAASFAKVSGIEQMLLANGTNAITLTNAMVTSALSTRLTVIGGTGNDTIDGSGITTAANRIDITLGTGNDTVKGGAGNDSFYVAASGLTNADTITGGAGFDTLGFTTAGTITSASLAKVSGIERIKLASGTNSILLTDVMVTSAVGRILAVVGNSGNDTIDGSGVTTAANRLDITADTGADTLKGGAGNDIFRFAAADLTNADTAAGNSGTDTLQFTTAGTVTSASLAKVSGIEQITLANGTNAITLTNTMVTSALNTRLTVIGGTGNDTIDGSGITTAANRIDITLGLGNDTAKGGAGNDSFFLAASALTNADTITGGAGFDTLGFSTAGTITAASLAKVSGIERIKLAAGTNSILLTDVIVTSAVERTLVVVGNSGTDLIDGANVVTSTNKLDITLDTGNDIVRGGVGADTFRVAASDLTSSDTIFGNNGTDTLAFSTAGTVTSANLANVSEIEQVTLANGTNFITLTNTMVTSALSTRLTVIGGTGNDTIDGSGITTAANRIDITLGTGNDTVKGGAGNDSFYVAASGLTNADTITGGTGFDTLGFSTAGTVTAASLAKVSGIDRIKLAAGTNSILLTDVMVTSAVGRVLAVIGNSGADTIDGSAVTAGNTLDINTDAGKDTLKGGAGADTLTVSGGSDTVDGGGGGDTIRNGSTGSLATGSTFRGGAGNDSIEYNTGTIAASQPLIDGGADSDTLVAFVSAYSLKINLGIANADQTQTLAGSDDFSDVRNFENIDWRLGGALIATGSTGANTILGSGKQDRIGGGGGADTLDGGDDRDTLVLNGTVAITFKMTLSADQTTGDTAIVRHFENVDGSAMTAGLTATGTGGDYALIGGSGNDTLLTNYVFSFASGVTLRGGGGNDRIEYNYAETQSSGVPLLDGESGSDTLTGVDHADALVIDLRKVNADQTTGDLSNVRNFENVDWTRNNGVLTATGSDGANALLGGFNADIIDGGAGNDRIGGGNGDDTLDGGDDRDTLVLTGATNVVFQGFVAAGDDQTTGDTSIVRNFESVDGSAMTGRLTASGVGANYVMIGGSGNDTLLTNYAFFFASGATLRGGGGNDRIEYNYADQLSSVVPLLDGESGIDTLLGIDHADNLVIDLSKVNADQTAGDLSNVRNFENVDWTGNSGTLNATGSAGANTILGGSNADNLQGGAGNDRIGGGGGADTLDGGDNSDTLVLIGADPLTFDATLSADQTTGDDAFVTQFENVDGSAMTGALTATGTGSGYTLIGGSGDDTLLTNYLSSTANGATVRGGGGEDRIEYNRAETASSVLPVLDGGFGSDTLLGVDHGDDLVIDLRKVNADQTTGDRADVRNFENVDWTGNTGDLTATVSTGVNRIYGGNGSNTLVLIGAGSLTIDLRLAGDQTAGDDDDIRGFDNIDGRAYSGALIVTAANDFSSNRLLGGREADVLDGNGGEDHIDGGGGDDTITNNFSEFNADGATFLGNSGNDRIEYATASSESAQDRFALLNGGADTDTLFAKLAEGLVTIDLSIVNADQTSGDRAEVRNFENVDWSATGTALTATGGAGANCLTGGGGIDTLTGGGGDDRLQGNGGADNLFGGTGNDTVVLLAGDFVSDELLNGGDNIDTLQVLGAGITSLRLGTVVGFEELKIGAGVDIILTAGQTDQFRTFTFSEEATSQTIDIVFSTPGSLDMATDVGYYHADASDRIVVTGSAGADTFVGGFLTDIIDGGGGDDVISSNPFFFNADNERVQGGAGNDRIQLNFGAAAQQPILDGGADSDTLFSTANAFTLDTRVAPGVDQTPLNGNVTVLNFENADWTGNNNQLEAFGGNESNVFTGGNSDDTLDGGGGDDTLTGNAEDDELTGGAGDDSFVYLKRGDGSTFGDTITDFGHASGDDDRFVFTFSEFTFNTDVDGFANEVNAVEKTTSIDNADLVRYTAGMLGSVSAVNAYLSGLTGNTTGDQDQGVFVLAKNFDDDTLLYYSAHAGGSEVDAEMIANLGTGIALADIQTGDFFFV